MKLLAIETSSPVLSLALFDGRNLYEKKIHGFLTHAENLLPVMDRMLKKRNLSLSKIDAFLIGRGPGSFTGLRVGYATYKALHTLGSKNFFGALSLDLIAENVLAKEGALLNVCLDARREKVYSRLYKKGKKDWQPKGSPQVLEAKAWLQTVPAQAFLAGDALTKYKTLIESNPGKKFQILPEKFWYPDASALVSLYQNRSKKIISLKSPKDFLPLYFRLSEAEERLNQHANSR